LVSQNSEANRKIKTTSSLKDIMATVDYFERKLDDKRRLTIPPELRDQFSSGAVVTRGFGQYLHLYPKDVWDNLVEPRLAGDILDERIADLNVRFRMGKVDMQPDNKQGRITLEQHLIDYAGIERDVVAVGVGSYWRLMEPKVAEKSLINN
jgi:MraZ protein